MAQGKYIRLKTDMATLYFSTNMEENLNHFRQESVQYLKGPGQYDRLSFLKICENLEGIGVLGFDKLDILKVLVESAPNGSAKLLEMIAKTKNEIQEYLQGNSESTAGQPGPENVRDGANVSTKGQPGQEYASDGGAEKFHKTDSSSLPFTTIQDMGRSDLNKSIGIIEIKIPGQPKGYGTGFRFGKSYVMTAYHVFKEIIEYIWKLVERNVELCDNNEDIFNEINERFVMSSAGNGATIIPKHQPLPFGRLFEYLKKRGIKVEVLEDRWKEDVKIDFGVREGKTTAGQFNFEYDIPFADSDHDVVVLEISKENSNLPPPLSLEQNLVSETVHLFGYPEGTTKIDLLSDVQCTVYTEAFQLKKFVKEAIVWWEKERNRSVEQHYADCRYDERKGYTDKGKVFLHASKQFEHRSSGCPAVAFTKEKPVVQLMYLEGYPKFCYTTKDFPPNKYLIEAGISMPFVTQLLRENCRGIME